MRIYAVYEINDPNAANQDPVLVPEGFSWTALLLAPLWTLWHRMWPVAFVVWAAMLGMGFLPQFASQWVTGSDLLSSLGFLTLIVVMGLVGNDLRGWWLTILGYELSEVVGGRNVAEAEQRYFTAMGPSFYRL
jgi:hypothetical protein